MTVIGADSDDGIVAEGGIISNAVEEARKVVIPGVAIFCTVLSMSLIGDGMNDAFNPKLRER